MLQKQQMIFEDIDLKTIDIVIEETALEVKRKIKKEKFDNSNEFDNYSDFLEAYKEIILDEIRQAIIFRLSQVEDKEEMILELEALKRSKYNRYSSYTNLQAIIDAMSIELKLI